MSGRTTARTHPAVRAVGQAVNTALARGARGYPSADLARDGYVLRPGLLDEGQAGAILDDVGHLADRELVRSGVRGARLRDRADRQSIDLNVRQISRAERLSTGIDALLRSGELEHTMAELTGLDVALRGLALQIDWPDTATKRGLHVDSHWPPTYKAFVYLTPVLGPENGPFSVVPGSHRDRIKKVRALAGNAVHRRRATDVDTVYRLSDARCLLGSPGTAIFADQRLAHAGWPDHTSGTRFMLVAYLYERGVRTPG